MLVGSHSGEAEKSKTFCQQAGVSEEGGPGREEAWVQSDSEGLRGGRADVSV